MKKQFIFTFTILICSISQYKGIAKNTVHEARLEKSSEWKLLSPDNQIEFVLSLDKEFGKLLYYVVNNGKQILLPSPLGIDREDEKFSSSLQFCSQNEVSLIDEEYELKSGKRLLCHNLANEQIYQFRNSNGKAV